MQRRHFGCVLVDLEEFGMDLVAALRSENGGRHLRQVFIGIGVQADPDLEGRHLDGYLRKPFSADSFEKELKAARQLALRKRRRLSLRVSSKKLQFVNLIMRSARSRSEPKPPEGDVSAPS